MKIYLFCSAGMSTSLLVTKMQKAAEEKALECHIEAFAESTLQDNGKEADVILLGPQIRYKEKAAKEMYPDKPVAAIDMRAYGMVDGKKVLETALEMYEANK
ncbi:MAG: PTS sugar transporter subunit IIB [Mycoplasmatales bacterium]